MEGEYHQGDTVYILMDATKAQGVLDDWLYHGYGCDLRLHRSVKSKGKIVVETRDPVWAARIIKWHSIEQVTYRNKKQ